MTSFTEKVLSVVRDIPRGSTLSYAEVAHRAGKPKAVRAVGTIMAKNYDITVPCHRVINSNGFIGSYNRGGIEKKIKMLVSEGVIISGKKLSI